MRESRTYGSVRGALSNERPYRDRSVPTLSGQAAPSFVYGFDRVGTARRRAFAHPTLATLAASTLQPTAHENLRAIGAAARLVGGGNTDSPGGSPAVERGPRAGGRRARSQRHLSMDQHRGHQRAGTERPVRPGGVWWRPGALSALSFRR